MSDKEEALIAVASRSDTNISEPSEDDQPAKTPVSKRLAPGETSDQDQDDDEEEGGWIGPMPTEAVPVKKRKGIYFVYLCVHNSNLNVPLFRQCLTMKSFIWKTFRIPSATRRATCIAILSVMW